LDAAGQAARQKLAEGHDPAVIGHCDWMTENLRWDGTRLLVAYDWDSLFAYATARGRPFSPGELQRCWAAGLWTRAFDARKQDAAQEEVTILTPDEAET